MAARDGVGLIALPTDGLAILLSLYFTWTACSIVLVGAVPVPQENID